MTKNDAKCCWLRTLLSAIACSNREIILRLFAQNAVKDLQVGVRACKSLHNVTFYGLSNEMFWPWNFGFQEDLNASLDNQLNQKSGRNWKSQVKWMLLTVKYRNVFYKITSMQKRKTWKFESTTQHAVRKCFVPREATFILMYGTFWH